MTTQTAPSRQTPFQRLADQLHCRHDVEAALGEPRRIYQGTVAIEWDRLVPTMVWVYDVDAFPGELHVRLLPSGAVWSLTLGERELRPTG